MINKVYCGWIDDSKKVIWSASGGLATAMSETVISAGGVVYGAAYSFDFKSSEYIRVEDAEGILRLKGSKYIKAKLTKELLDSLARDAKDGRKVLFIGLPCDTAAARSYVEKNELSTDNIIFTDLICHGATSPKVAEEFIEKIENKYKSKVVEFSVRYKNPYWTPLYLFAKFENGKKHIQLFNDTDYGIAFSQMPGINCYNCVNKGENYKSDITIGDYWGSKEGDVGFNKYGSSVAFTHTEKGDGFINSLSNFCLYDADMEKALNGNPRYSTSVKRTKENDVFRKNFDEKGLGFAARKYRISRLKRRILKLLRLNHVFGML